MAEDNNSNYVIHKYYKWIVIICLLFMGTGLYLGFRSYIFFQNAITTTGKIIEMKEVRGENNSTYAPVFIFKDAKGVTHTILSHTSSNPPVGNVGDSIKVLYNPINPENAYIDNFFNLWGAAALSFCCGLFCLIATFVIRKQKPTASTNQKFSGSSKNIAQILA